jgi:hypothetical protein
MQAAHQYNKVIGWKTPHLPSIINIQRITRMQHLVNAERSIDGQWSCIAHKMFQKVTAPYFRPFWYDFLHYKPNIRHSNNTMKQLTPIWVDVWTHWNKLPPDKLFSVQPTIQQLLMMPIWRQKYPVLCLPFHPQQPRRALIYCFKQYRQWYEHVVRCGFHCLADFLTARNTWPTADEFDTIVTTYTRQVEYDGPIPYSLRPLYSRLTRLAGQVYTFSGETINSPVNRTAAFALPFNVTYNNKKVHFMYWAPKSIQHVCFNPPMPTRNHPLMTISRPDVDSIKVYIDKFKAIMKTLLPLHSDIWTRVIYCTLPVGYRFYHMQLLHPNSMSCAYPTCSAVETIQHALRYCTKINTIWKIHQGPWSEFGQCFEWENIINVDLQVVHHWLHIKPVLYRLWAMLTGGTLRCIWLHRNKSKYEAHNDPHTSSMVECTILNWSSQIRRWLMHPATTADERTQANNILHRLGCHSNYRPLWTKYALQFSVKSQQHRNVTM